MSDVDVRAYAWIALNRDKWEAIINEQRQRLKYDGVVNRLALHYAVGKPYWDKDVSRSSDLILFYSLATLMDKELGRELDIYLEKRLQDAIQKTS